MAVQLEEQHADHEPGSFVAVDVRMVAHDAGGIQVDGMCQSAIERQLEIAGDALGQLRKLDSTLFARIPQGHKKEIPEA